MLFLIIFGLPCKYWQKLVRLLNSFGQMQFVLIKSIFITKKSFQPKQKKTHLSVSIWQMNGISQIIDCFSILSVVPFSLLLTIMFS